MQILDQQSEQRQFEHSQGTKFVQNIKEQSCIQKLAEGERNIVQVCRGLSSELMLLGITLVV